MTFLGIAKEVEADILSIISIKEDDDKIGGRDTVKVLLNPNPLYPGGGGQPCDKGYVTWNEHGKERKAEICECMKTPVGKETILRSFPGQGSVLSLEKGMRIMVHVDVQRRASLTKAHSGEHVLFQSIQRVLETDSSSSSKRHIEVKKVDLDILESSLFVLTNHLSWGDLLKAEQLANSIIREDRQVIEHSVTKQEFMTEQQKGQQSKYKDIRIKFDRIKDDVIRIMEVKDFDYSACAGTHVTSTGNIGNVLITKFANSGPGEFEIRFKVDTPDVFFFAGFARLAAAAAHINVEQLVHVMQRLIAEQDVLKESSRAIQRQQSLELSSMKTSGVTVRSGAFSFDDKKILIEKVSSLLQDGEIAIIGNKPQAQDSGPDSLQMFFFSRNPAVDAGALVRQLAQHLPLKGGGSRTFAASGTTASYEEVMAKAIANIQQLLKTP